MQLISLFFRALLHPAPHFCSCFFLLIFTHAYFNFFSISGFPFLSLSLSLSLIIFPFFLKKNVHYKLILSHFILLYSSHQSSLSSTEHVHIVHIINLLSQNHRRGLLMKMMNLLYTVFVSYVLSCTKSWKYITKTTFFAINRTQYCIWFFTFFLFKKYYFSFFQLFVMSLWFYNPILLFFCW